MLNIYNVFKTSIANLLSGGASFLLSVTVARFLCPEENGHYAQFSLISNLFFIFFNFGLGNGLTYFISNGSMSLSQAKIFCKNIVLLSLLIIGIIFLLVFISSDIRKVLSNFDVPIIIFLMGILGGCLLLAINMCSFVFLGERKYDLFNLSTFNRNFIPLMLVFGCALEVKNALSFSLATILGLFITLCWGRSKLRINLEANKLENRKNFYLRQMWSYSLPSYLANLLHYASNRGLAFSLSYFKTIEEVGYLLLALIFLESVLIVPGAIGQILFPKVSDNDFNPEKINFMLRISIVIGLVVSIGVYICSPTLIHLLLGPAYDKVGQVFSLLAPSVLLLTIPKILSQVLSGRGLPYYPLYAGVLSAILSLYIGFFQVHTYGLQACIYAVNFISLITATITILGYTSNFKVLFKEIFPGIKDIKYLVYFICTRVLKV
jgi:O-antigen/teichoic acid export membrane protein